MTKQIKKRVYNDMIVRKLKQINRRKLAELGKGYGSTRYKQRIKVWEWMWYRGPKPRRKAGEVDIGGLIDDR